MVEEKSTEKLKIAMLGYKRVPSREGGIEIVVEKLASRMVVDEHEVTCTHIGASKAPKSKEKPRGGELLWAGQSKGGDVNGT